MSSQPTIESKTLKESEARDCIVRAISNAFGISYEAAHAHCKIRGRRFRKGFYTSKCLVDNKPSFKKDKWYLTIETENDPVTKFIEKYPTSSQIFEKRQEYERKNLKLIALKKSKVKRPKFKPTPGISIKKFIAKNPKGTFIVDVHAHATCVKDGVLLDSNIPRRMSQHIESYYRISDKIC